MINQQLIDYIKDRLQEGKNKETIANYLLGHGYGKQEVGLAFEMVENKQYDAATARIKTKDFTKEPGTKISKKLIIFLLFILIVAILGAWQLKKQKDEARMIQFAVDVLCVTFEATADFSKLYPQIKSEQDIYNLSLKDIMIFQQFINEKMQPVLRKYNLTEYQFSDEVKKAEEFIRKSDSCGRKFQKLLRERGCI